MPEQKDFKNIYIRSSLECDGTIPAKGSSHSSPDMFSNGMQALPDHISVLSSTASYAALPDDKATENMVNYCYLRCRNNSGSEIKGAKAEMFYTEANLVLWPDSWIPMPTDISKSSENTLTDMKPGDIGVVQRPFLWNMPQGISKSNHYCYIGRLFTDATPNPKPPVKNPIDMAEIIKTNLMYAKRNILTIQPHEKADGFYNTLISTSDTLENGPSKYHLFFNSTGLAGCDVEITCSSPDSQGRQIKMERRTIPNNDDMYFGQCMLNPGFSALLTVYIYYNGKPAPVGATTNVWINYSVVQSEMERFKRAGLYDPNTDKHFRLLTGANSHETTAFAHLGGVTGVIR